MHATTTTHDYIELKEPLRAHTAGQNALYLTQSHATIASGVERAVTATRFSSDQLEYRGRDPVAPTYSYSNVSDRYTYSRMHDTAAVYGNRVQQNSTWVAFDSWKFKLWEPMKCSLSSASVLLQPVARMCLVPIHSHALTAKRHHVHHACTFSRRMDVTCLYISLDGFAWLHGYLSTTRTGAA